MAAKTKCKLNCDCKLNTDPFQWWIQAAPPPPLFLVQTEAWTAEKTFLGRPGPPPHPYLRVWMTRLSLISRSGFGTAFVLGTKHLIGDGNKTYRCNRTAVKTPRLRFLGKLFLKLIPARRLYLVGLWGTLSGTCFHFPQNMYARHPRLTVSKVLRFLDVFLEHNLNSST